MSLYKEEYWNDKKVIRNDEGNIVRVGELHISVIKKAFNLGYINFLNELRQNIDRPILPTNKFMVYLLKYDVQEDWLNATKALPYEALDRVELTAQGWDAVLCFQIRNKEGEIAPRKEWCPINTKTYLYWI